MDQSVFFTFDKIIAILGLLTAWLAGLQLWTVWKERRQKQTLDKEFGSTYFSRDIINITTRYYIRPDCSNVDPSREDDMDNVIGLTADLFGEIDKFLAKKSTYRHMIILADSGMGKTSALVNYYLHNQERNPNKRQRIALVPLGLSETDGYIQSIQGKRKTVLFIDAFDEDTKAIEDHRARLYELMRLCEDFSHVVLTCRTQFFPTDEEIPAETGIIRVGPRRAGQGAIYKFQKLYLTPLTDAQVKQYLRKRYPLWRWSQRRDAQRLVEKVPQLSVRPMLLTFIPDILTATNQSEINYTFELYEALIEAWIIRENHWVKPDNLRQFSKRLAVDLFVNRENRGQECIHPTELRMLAQEWQIPLEDWQITGRSLLNRDAEGNYKFTHRSIMNYLFIQCNVSQLDIDWSEIRLTDQMQSFVDEIISAKQFDLLYMLPGTNLPGANLTGANLTGANLTETNLIGADLRGANLARVNLKLARYDGATKWPNRFDYRNSGAIGPYANLIHMDLSYANFSYLDLSQANLQNVDLSGSNLQGTSLTQANLDGADLSGANLCNARLNQTNLKNVTYDPKTQWPENFNLSAYGLDLIQKDHPLLLSMQTFFAATDFLLEPLDNPLSFICSPKLPKGSKQLPERIYIRVLIERTLDHESVTSIHQEAKAYVKSIEAILVVINLPPIESGLLSMMALAADGVTLIPVDEGLMQEGLFKQKEQHMLYDRIRAFRGREQNFYDERHPVTNQLDFFGRNLLCQELLRVLETKGAVALIGLRKMGKSSTVQALRNSAKYPVAYIDLQAGTNLSNLFKRILQQWAYSLSIRHKQIADLWRPPIELSINPAEEFITATYELIDWLEQHQLEIHLGIYIDEIELIIPDGDITFDDSKLLDYLTFARTLRGLVQETKSVSLLVTGLDLHFNRRNRWGNDQNPFYQFFQEVFLGPLNRENCLNMIRSIGHRMGIKYRENALDLIFEFSGGHPFFARQICSLNWKLNNDPVVREEMITITAANFIINPNTSPLIDDQDGLWQETTNPNLWSQRQIEENKYILRTLARNSSVKEKELFKDATDSKVRQQSLFELINLSILKKEGDGTLSIQFQIFRTWIQKYKLK